MASYLQIENISKSYGPKVLFEKIGFNINEGDKIALIAPNGTGKTSLLRILAGEDRSDSGGKITFLKEIRIAFLEQEYPFEGSRTILEQVHASAAGFIKTLDAEAAAEYELNLRIHLTEFQLADLDMKMSQLSGGEVKRVALAQVLAMNADFYIMDEPTNHLDLDAIEYLESWLSHRRCTLLMVTHDRYFLERVCNTIFEIDHGQLFIYKGDYENYLAKRDERISNYNAETDKVRNILRRELEWMRATPCARTGKAKYRKDAFYELQDRASQVYTQKQVDMSEVGIASRLGTKIFNCKDLSFHYGDRCMLKGFTYNFARGERVGIVGSNGAGKSTFLNLLSASAASYYDEMGIAADAAVTRALEAVANGTRGGVLEVGESVRIGYYSQKGISFREDQTVLETVTDTHLLNMFMFSHDMFSNYISKLSGGEKRRLYLLTVLMQKPNVLILDEPTNDLDIITLNILEEYLLDYHCTLIIVSHDRHFLDRLVDHLLIFCGDGSVKDFIGGYTAYRTYLTDYKAEQRRIASQESQSGAAKQWVGPAVQVKEKMSYKEKREFEALGPEIEALTSEKAALEAEMSSGSLPYDRIQAAAARHKEVSDLLDEKEMRWLELSEKA